MPPVLVPDARAAAAHRGHHSLHIGIVRRDVGQLRLVFLHLREGGAVGRFRVDVDLALILGRDEIGLDAS